MQPSATGKVTGDEQLVLYFDRNLETLEDSTYPVRKRQPRSVRQKNSAKTNLLTKQKYSFDSNGKLANCEKKDPSQL